MPYCDIMQGIPGSGKSTYANSLNVMVCSADDYHVGEGGTYNWKPDKVGAAHQACMLKFLTRVYNGRHVCVDNTNTTLEEMAPYVRVAQAMGYIVRIHTFVCSAETSAQRNTHGVPLKSCERMLARMATPPKRWDIEHIVTHTNYTIR